MSIGIGASVRASFLLLATIGASACPSVSTAMTIAEQSRTDYTIVIASNATAPEKTAAAELRDYLKQITGADFAIKTEAQVKSDAPQILVGQSGRAKALCPDVNWDSLGHDGIVLRTVGDRLVLAGGRPRGTLYAVYAFLEDVAGVRWWTSTESYIPSKPTLRIPDLNTCYTPKLIYREAYYRDPTENPLFAARLRMNGYFFSIPPEYGSHVGFVGFVHTAYGLIPPDAYFAQHPEWFSEIDGKRTTERAQLCLTNDDMRKELTRKALEWLAANKTAGIISISQNDNTRRCQCAKCMAVEAEEGSPSGPLVRFVNAVAEDIEKKYPDMLVETLAYQYTRKPPLHVKPRSNVLIRLCSIECDFSRPLGSESNKSFRDDMLGWKAIASKLFIWDYVTNYGGYIQPHPNMRVLAPNLRFFVDNNAVGVFEQGDSYTTVGDFIRLRTWVFAHLLWNPSLDEKKLAAEFMRGYYGPAAPHLQAYLDLVHDSWEKSARPLTCVNQDLSFLSLEVMNEAMRHFDRAARAVANDEVLSRRVRRERLPLDHMWLVRYYDLKEQAEVSKAPFGGPEDPAKAYREFIALAREWKADFNSEGSTLDSYMPQLEAKLFPVPKPEDFSKLPKEDCIELTPDQFYLWGAPEWVQLVDDPLASTGKAARMPGNHNKYAVQCHITPELLSRLDGNWKCYAIVRCETGPNGGALRRGIFDDSTKRSVVWIEHGVEKVWDGRYRTYYLGSRRPTSDMYFWVAPNGDEKSTQAIYVERFVVVRDKQLTSLAS